MAFTVEDFQDLLRLLEQRPEWQAELRRRVLTDELLELPALVRQLIAAQARTEERLERLESTVAKLAEAQLRTEEALLALTGRFEEHERRNALDLQPLKEFALAQKLADRPGVFRPLLTEPEPLRPAEASAWFTTLADEGRLAPDEYQELLWADLLVRGRRDQQEGYLVVETSWTIGLRDVDRAARRAWLLQERAGVRAWPAVVGYRVAEQAEPRLARQEVLSIVLPE
jgi:hypothetical protein